MNREPDKLGTSWEQHGAPGSQPSETSLAAEGPRVLIVDDEADAIQALKLRLENSGYRTISAADGAEALELLRDNSVDLIVTDLMMPNLDGLELTRRIRQDPSRTALPVMLFSCNDDPIARNLALEFGAIDYLSKTLGAREIVSRIEQILTAAKPSDSLVVPHPDAYRLAEADLISELRAISNNCIAPSGRFPEGGESPAFSGGEAAWATGDLPRLAEALAGRTESEPTTKRDI